jgi:hypothetical protein
MLNRQERIEKSGPLGKADVANKELDLVEQQLQASMKAGQQPDGLCMYLLGVICAERCVVAQCQFAPMTHVPNVEPAKG